MIYAIFIYRFLNSYLSWFQFSVNWTSYCARHSLKFNHSYRQHATCHDWGLEFASRLLRSGVRDGRISLGRFFSDILKFCPAINLILSLSLTSESVCLFASTSESSSCFIYVVNALFFLLYPCNPVLHSSCKLCFCSHNSFIRSIWISFIYFLFSPYN